MTKARPGASDVGSPLAPCPPAPVRGPLLLLILARNERGLTVREEAGLATAAEDVLDAAGVGGQRVHATLEPAVISGDPVLAERLIANLVDNAARYTTLLVPKTSSMLVGADAWAPVMSRGPKLNLGELEWR
jgi:hypothetical protein